MTPEQQPAGNTPHRAGGAGWQACACGDPTAPNTIHRRGAPCCVDTGAQPAHTAPQRVRCVHDYVLLQDSCPGCDHAQETPHTADPVTVRPRWAKRDMRRCRRCALQPSARIHHREQQPASRPEQLPAGPAGATRRVRRAAIDLLLARAQRGVLTRTEAGHLAGHVREEIRQADTAGAGRAAAARPARTSFPPEAEEAP